MTSAHNSSDPAPTCQTKASVQISSDPAPECQTMVLEHDSLSPERKCQENVSHGDKTDTTSNELDLLFSPMFDELLNGSSKVVSKSSAVSAADAPNHHQNSSDPAPECQTMTLNHDSLSPVIQRQTNVSQADRTVKMSNELDLLFSLMFDELINGSSKAVSESSAVSAADAPNQRQQYTTPLNNHTTPAPSCQIPTIAPTVISSENINQAETHAENDQVVNDEFINIFSTPVQDQGETLSRHTMALEHDSLCPGRKCQENVSHGDKTGTTSNELDLLFSLMFDELLNGSSKVVSKSSAVSTADAPNQQSDAEMCMFALTVSRTEPKNIKEAMADSAWIESMQEELHQFDRLDV
nr:putative ribonuclease H-like domain-containing protein [Tanacetum cinerariifolium]